MGYCNRYNRYTYAQYNQAYSKSSYTGSAYREGSYYRKYSYTQYNNSYAKSSYTDSKYSRYDGQSRTKIIKIPWTNFNEDSGTVSGMKNDELNPAAIAELRQHIKAIEYQFVDSANAYSTWLEEVEDIASGQFAIRDDLNTTDGDIKKSGKGLMDGALDADIPIEDSNAASLGETIKKSKLINLAQKIEDCSNRTIDLTTGYSNLYTNGYNAHSRTGGYAQSLYYVGGNSYGQAWCGGSYWRFSDDGYGRTNSYGYWQSAAGYSRNVYTQYINSNDNQEVNYKDNL